MILMAIHHSEISTLLHTEFSYTSCTDLYSTMAANDVRVLQTEYTTGEAPERPLH